MVNQNHLFVIRKSSHKMFFFLKLSALLLLFISTIFSFPNNSFAINQSKGEDLFINHCSGCHVNGGNIIRRNKTLKLKDLKKNDLDSPEAIAKIAAKGIGSMDGYEKVLEGEGDQLVANWIWEQAQNAWVHG